jgi:hypothetical protein
MMSSPVEPKYRLSTGAATPEKIVSLVLVVARIQRSAWRPCHVNNSIKTKHKNVTESLFEKVVACFFNGNTRNGWWREWCFGVDM